MTEEQQRVKNLLVDTVILLCKNSLQFDCELCVEGLLGVKVDKHDVFFLHISETFKGSAGVSGLSQRDQLNNGDRGDSEDIVIDSGPSEDSDGVTEIKDGHNENQEVTVEQSIQENGCELRQQEQQESSGTVRAAPLVSGQRRVPRKASSPHRNWTAVSCTSRVPPDSPFVSDSDCLSSSECSNEPQKTFQNFDSFGKCEELQSDDTAITNTPDDKNQPLCKLQQVDGARVENGLEGSTSSVNEYGHEKVSTPWLNIVGQLELPTQPAPYGEAEGPCSIVSNISQQPGCSAWPTNPHHNPIPQMDLVVPPPHFMLAMGVDSHPVLSSPHYPPPLAPVHGMQPARRSRGSSASGGVPRRRREWCGKWFNCDLCRYQTKRLWNLQRHMRKHAVRGPLLSGPAMMGLGATGHCPLCGDDSDAIYVSDAELRHHLMEDHKEATAAHLLYGGRLEEAVLRHPAELPSGPHSQVVDMTISDENITVLKEVCTNSHTDPHKAGEGRDNGGDEDNLPVGSTYNTPRP